MLINQYAERTRRKAMGRLTDKVALVTGGSRGIGKAIAMAYAREGARVLISARRKEGLAATGEEIRRVGGEAQWQVADLSKAKDVKRLVREAIRSFGSIHILVNNASLLGPRETIARYPLSAWEEVVRVNLTGLFMVTKEVLGIMIPGGEGSIINVSSGVGRVGKARWGAYSVSKFGVEGFTQVLAEEVKDRNIRVNAVNPGGTRTEMRAEAYPDEDPMTLPHPDEITGAFVYLATEESAGVTGKSFDARDWLKK